MGKATGWILVLVGGLIMCFPPISIFLPIKGLFPLFFMRPQLMYVFIGIGFVFLMAGIVFLVASQDKLSEKRMEVINQQFPCPVCKKDVFTWAKVPSAVIRLRVGLGQPTWARVCDNCGNVQQFTKTP